LVVLAVNHEFGTGFVEEPFEELNSIATESVFVGNHNFVDISLVYSFQKPLETLSVVVES
jgi:hypothetical protein